jgi:hypothetical protein
MRITFYAAVLTVFGVTLLSAAGPGERIRAEAAEGIITFNEAQTIQSSGEQLRAEAAKGNISGMQALLSAGTDVNAKDLSGVTALMEAVHAGKVEAVKFLISQGADVNATADRDGVQITPLSVASENIEFVNMWTSQEGALLTLIRKKRRQTNNQNANDIARALLAAGASVDKSPSFLEPDYLQLAPKSVAIVQVIDGRSEKPDEKKMRDKLDLHSSTGATAARQLALPSGHCSTW